MTPPEPTPLPRRFRLAGALIASGLLVEISTLIWSHPTAFLAFACLGATLAGAGVLTYLHALMAFPGGRPGAAPARQAGAGQPS
jgi:hypothetical protein